MTVIVDDYAVHYEQTGRGPLLLTLHGWGDNEGTFSQLTKLLASEYTILSVDLPGFGKTDRPREPFNLESYAQFVAKFLEKANVHTLHAIIGHSNGGAIAIKGMSMGILQADSLVLLASAGVRSTYSGKKKAFRLMAKAAKLPTKLLPGAMQQNLKKKAYARIGSDLFVAEHLQETFKRIVAEDVVFESAMIAVPTLLIYGANDKSTPPDYGSRFAKQIERSELKVIENADHFLHHTHANEVARLIRGFLEKV